MDILVKFERSPRSLKALSLDSVCQVVANFIFKVQSSKPGDASRHMLLMQSVETSVQNWTSHHLPVSVREELVDLLIRKLMSSSFLVEPATSPALLASVMEMLFSPLFKSLSLPFPLQWHRESRTRVLHLLHQKDARLETLSFPCYKAQIFKFEALIFSEKFILINCFYRFSRLKKLFLPNVCDDEMLAYIASNCKNLEEVDVSGSFGVTNQGLRWFCGQEKPPSEHISFSSHNAPLKEKEKNFLYPLDFRRRPAFKPTIFARCYEEKNLIELSCLNTVNFTDTSIDGVGLELILHKFKNLIQVHVDDAHWTSLLETMNEASTGCLDCISGNKTMRSINMGTNVAEHLPLLSEIFPNLGHLVLNKVTPGEQSINLEETLGDFENLRSLTVKETHFETIYKSLKGNLSGKSIHSLRFSGTNCTLDLAQLDENCPNLSLLSVTHSKITRSQSGGRDNPPKLLLNNLKSLKLWEISSQPDSLWSEVLRGTVHLQKLYLWNMRISDADLQDILKGNSLRKLQDVRVASGDTNFVPLTENSILNLIKYCPDLVVIGGICGWRTENLMNLLQGVLMSEGWKISMEENGSW